MTEKLATQIAALTTIAIMVACLKMGRQHVSVRKNKRLIVMVLPVSTMTSANTKMAFANLVAKIKLVVLPVHVLMGSTLTLKT